LRIAITGGTGFVGSALTSYLSEQGHTLFILTRKKIEQTDPNITYVEWLHADSKPESMLSEIDAFVNLAGESINSGRWTKVRKEKIISSRIQVTKEVIRILSKLDKKPDILLNASAIGIYGTSFDATFTEDSPEIGKDFLAQTVDAWEAEALKVEELGIEVALMRFGIILGKNAGALPKMLLPYQLFIGGTIGSGHQWLSWVHIEDVVKSIEFVMKNKITGPVNITAPFPERMSKFGQTIGKVLKRPHFLPVPSICLRLLLGEMSILVLEGQKVIPEKLVKSGYKFSYLDLEKALKQICASD